MFKIAMSTAAGATVLMLLAGSGTAHAQQKPSESDEWIAAQNEFAGVSVALGLCVRSYAAAHVFDSATPEALADAGLDSCSGRLKNWKRAFLESMRLGARDSGSPVDNVQMEKQAEQSLAQFVATVRKSAIDTVVRMRTPK